MASEASSKITLDNPELSKDVLKKHRLEFMKEIDDDAFEKMFTFTPEQLTKELNIISSTPYFFNFSLANFFKNAKELNTNNDNKLILFENPKPDSFSGTSRDVYLALCFEKKWYIVIVTKTPKSFKMGLNSYNVEKGNYIYSRILNNEPKPYNPDSYKSKYIKYKQKYLQLKKKLSLE